MDHAVHEEVGLELGRRIAAGLPSHPEWLDHARANLARWRRRNAHAASLVRCYDEWTAILEGPGDEIVRILSAAGDPEAARLRTNSPFVGIVPPREVEAIKRAVRARHAERAPR
jgi:hypothetical protein